MASYSFFLKLAAWRKSTQSPARGSLRQSRADRIAQRPVLLQVEERRLRPVVRKGVCCAHRFRLVCIARVDVRVQGGLEVAEDGVVDTQRPGGREHRIAEPAQVGQEPVALGLSLIHISEPTR